MASPSSTVRGGFDWRGAFRRGSGWAFGRRGAGAAPARRAAPAAGVEPLEGRRLLSVTLVSANTTGGAAGSRDQFAVSDNGQFVAFVSDALAGDLGVSGAVDSVGTRDVFLKNLTTGAVTLVSGVGNTAVGGQFPSVSADGRYVAFSTTSAAFASGAFTDTNGSSNDIYVFDSTANTYTLASAANSATAAIGNSIQPSISNNGRVVAFVTTTAADQLVSGVTDSNAARDVFVRNLDANTTVLTSVNTAGTGTGNARSEEPAISGDGAYVAFMSQATDLTAVPDASATTNDVFRRAVAGTTTDLVSVASGTGGATSAGGTGPSINANGNLVAFASGDQSLAPGDPSSGTIDVFVRDVAAGTSEVISVSSTGAFGNANSTNPSLSDDGNFVAFQSSASNLTADTNAAGSDVFLKNRADESVTRVSQTDAGAPGTAGGAGASSSFASVNGNGTAVAFLSQATNFAAGSEDPAAATDDLFVWRSANVTPGDTTVPTATISSPTVTAEGATPATVTIVYADDTAIDVSTIGADDITVTGPGGATTPLTVTGATATPSTNAASVSVAYTVSAPGATWDAADNGAYVITLPANAVRDTSGNGVAAGTAPLTVNVGGPPGGVGPDLTVAVAEKPALPAAVIGGQRGRVRLTVTNQGDAPVASPVSIQLRAVPTGATTGTPTDITTITRPLRLKVDKSRSVTVPFVYPSVPDGTYSIVAVVDSTNGLAEGNESNNTGTSASPVTIAAPFVDLSAAVGAPTRGSFTLGKRTSVPVTITNNGNVPASGTITIQLFASSDGVIGGPDTELATVTKRVKLRNGRARAVRVNFVVPPTLAAGQYFVTTNVDSANGIPESDETNNTAVSSIAFQAS